MHVTPIRKLWPGALPPLPQAATPPEYFGKDEGHIRAARSISTVAKKPTAQISERQGRQP